MIDVIPVDGSGVSAREIAQKLEESRVAIICLTSDNLNSHWIHFEAGAISKNTDAHLCTFLFDVTPANVNQPLSQFQNTKNEKSDLLKLIKTIKTSQNEASPLFKDIFDGILRDVVALKMTASATFPLGQNWNLSCVL